jgi:ATP-dependent Clp protease ATP-binding subunit ClpB
LAYIAAQGYDVLYGARPMKRTIQQHLETPLAKIILAGDIYPGDCIRVSHTSDGLDFEVQHGERET